jgi:hypothetical protein
MQGVQRSLQGMHNRLLDSESQEGQHDSIMRELKVVGE